MGSLQSVVLLEGFSGAAQWVCLQNASVNEEMLAVPYEKNPILQQFPSTQVQQQNLDFYIQAAARGHSLQCLLFLISLYLVEKTSI